MPLMSRDRSALLVVDLQARLVPAIADGAAVVAQAGRLMRVAERLGVPVLLTEQNPKGLGATVPELAAGAHPVLEKRAFSATRAEGFSAALPDRPQVVVAGCEAHVCVLQTVAGLIEAGRRVFVVEDASARARPPAGPPPCAGWRRTAPRSSPSRWWCSSGWRAPRIRCSRTWSRW